MSDLQSDDLVLVKQGEHKGQIGLYVRQCESVPQYHYIRHTPDHRNIIGSFGIHKITPLTIENLRSHDFSQGDLQLWQASVYGLTELSIHSWKFEQAAWGQQLSLHEFQATRTFGPSLKGIKGLYLSKDDGIVASAWMLREQQAERRKQIADLEQQEREMLAGLGS